MSNHEIVVGKWTGEQCSPFVCDMRTRDTTQLVNDTDSAPELSNVQHHHFGA